MFQSRSRDDASFLSAPGRLCLVLLLLIGIPLIPGCGGCSDSSTASQTDKEKEAKDKEKEGEKKADKPKPKPDFDRMQLNVVPFDGQDLTRGIKPGHWSAATLDLKANNFDFAGELEAGIHSSAADNPPVDIEHTAYRLLSARPSNLPKGQAKRLELLFFAPRSTSTQVHVRLTSRGGGAEALQDRQPLTHLPSYQYYFYVLSSQPDRYRYLKVIDTVKPPWDDLASKDRDAYYRVQLPRVTQNVSLPSQALAWTSIAVLLWDDIHPKTLRGEQQQALVDWLHWGGQLLISGPRTLDLLKGSFLEPYLPATGGDTVKLDATALADLNSHWTVATIKGLETPLAVTQPWTGVQLTKHDAAEFIPGTGNLLVERRVGRGRVVVSAFRLIERDLFTWRSFDSLFNNALLRRPRRVYSERDAQVIVDWVGGRRERFDPALISQLRFFSRDGGSAEEREKYSQQAGLPADIMASLSDEAINNPFGVNVPPADPTNPAMDAYADSRRIAAEAHQPGVAGWSDFSPVSHSARESLREAAGIVVPQRSFVVWVVGIYLLVIVPLNWLFFSAFGKVEWAWAAAPILAIICAMLVVKLARLDIGFARSKTEISVVELQGNYQRAHITRYTALYTSLSTGYDVHFDDSSAVAAPLGDPAFNLVSGESSRPAMYRRDDHVHLLGYQISSNSTSMLHSEHMLDLGGALEWQNRGNLSPQLMNNTQLPLEGVAVVRRTLNDEKKPVLESAWIGTLRPRQSVLVSFKPIGGKVEYEERETSSVTMTKPPTGTISLRSLVRLAEEGADLKVGDARLVGWTEEEIPGMTIEPRSSQHRHATLIVANLCYGLGDKPMKDVNTRADATTARPDDPDDFPTELEPASP